MIDVKYKFHLNRLIHNSYLEHDRLEHFRGKSDRADETKVH